MKALKFTLLLLLCQFINLKGFSQEFEILDINNVAAQINAAGTQFLDLENNNPSYEVPKGSGIHSMFASSLWIGGKDQNGQLRLSADMYGESDFQTGPLSTLTATIDSQTVENYKRVWKVSKQEIIDHLIAFRDQDPNYVIPKSISEWPGNGDPLKNEDIVLAPFVDINGDGTYDPYNGDYPRIGGDQAIFFILNDFKAHFLSLGAAAIGIEIKVMAYAYDEPSNPHLNNTVFVKYEIDNRSNFTLTDTYIGIWSDIDLGNYQDDFIGCDVMRNTYYAYNGDNHDEDGRYLGYGINPPTQAVTLLNGPFLDADGIDNKFGISNGKSPNGFGFGDGIRDNERIGMTSFIHHGIANPYRVNGLPDKATDFYGYMQGIWKDSSQIVYGGNGLANGCTLPDSCFAAKFMFPDESDTLGYGTNGQKLSSWNEVAAGHSPDDRRGLAAMGPFTMHPGAKNFVDVAYTFTRKDGDGNFLMAIESMQESVDSVKAFFERTNPQNRDGFDPIILSSDQQELSFVEVTIHPNPANEYLQVELENLKNTSPIFYEIFDIMGKKVNGGKLQKRQIKINDLQNGIYLLELNTEKGLQVAKFVKE